MCMVMAVISGAGRHFTTRCRRGPESGALGGWRGNPEPGPPPAMVRGVWIPWLVVLAMVLFAIGTMTGVDAYDRRRAR